MAEKNQPGGGNQVRAWIEGVTGRQAVIMVIALAVIADVVLRARDIAALGLPTWVWPAVGIAIGGYFLISLDKKVAALEKRANAGPAPLASATPLVQAPRATPDDHIKLMTDAMVTLNYQLSHLPDMRDDKSIAHWMATCEIEIRRVNDAAFSWPSSVRVRMNNPSPRMMQGRENVKSGPPEFARMHSSALVYEAGLHQAIAHYQSLAGIPRTTRAGRNLQG